MSEPDFWNDVETAQLTMQKNKAIEYKLTDFDALESEIEDALVLFELAQDDGSMEKELHTTLGIIEAKMDALKIATLLSGEYDMNNAIVSIHAGSGGLDAQDWTKMLLRMYDRFALNMNYKVIELDMIADPEAGIKSVTLKI